MTKTILIIDDEPDLIKLLDYNLTRENFLVISARDGVNGVRMAREHLPDLIILDIMMPGMDGWEVCKILRADKNTMRIPILILTARGEETEKVVGLELGADDYLTKPFSVKELIARVRAILRRVEISSVEPQVIKFGKLKIDSASHRVTIQDKEITLTPTEFGILKMLAMKADRVLARDDLLCYVRGDDNTTIQRSVDVHIASLRKKLGKCAHLIETVRGVGYRMRV